MNILVWNVQGLGNDWTFRILHDYVQQYSPSLIFLSETLCSKAQMERLRVRLGYTGMLTWEREGRSGGLCLLWSDSIHVQLLSGSKGHIDVQVTSHDSTCWRFTGLYGNPDTSLRTQFWTLLKRLGDASSMPWLCGGDLNEILFGHEKQGGATRAQYLMNAFREAANYCGLADLGFRGPKFTWNRGKNACLVQERLDRMLGNSGWLDLFPNSLVHHLNLRGSDHRPLLVELLRVDDSSSFGKIWKRGRFHFEEAWVDERECSNLIKTHWRSSAAVNLDGVANKLRLCATDLEIWNLESFRRLKTQVRKAQTAFDRVDKNLSNQNWKEHLRLERTLDALRYKEERYWKQRSKDLWLKCGDKNSKFFHQKASARKAKNSISGLLDENGEWCEKEEGLALIIESYFKSLFTSSSPSATNYDRVLDTIEPKITPQLNRQLERDFEAEDVRTAVFQMAPTKSPGADGMSAIFYQKFWPTVGEEITSACLGFVNGGHPLGSINETIITLLPKIKNPTRITEFRPISLCNVLYKIISKMLANRLRKIMDSVISQEQSAFIPGRLISDNAIIGFECLHAIKRQKTKKNFLALKLDMAKAYDRVEWGFIYKIMNKLGFSEVWTNKIMACISSVSYSFQFNGQRVGHLIPSRGLRQGDPLSPYLFLLCGEGLSSLLHHYEQSGLIQGLRCGLRGPTISHLFFADDSLLFFEAKSSACSALKEALDYYETASGQAVNLSKSAVCFGPNLPEVDAVDLTACLGVPRVRCHEKYLGLPCYTGKNKQGIFSSIKDRVWNKLSGWKSKLLSAGGREVLAKSIIQAIPAYSMSLFKIPSTLIKELHRLCAQFWWGGNPGKRRMHWCNWEKLCSHKLDGGMGFRDLRLFNKAILAKQAWRIHTHPTSLAARVLQGFYFHKSSFLQVKVNSSSSFVWRSILWGRELYKQGLRHKIGSGRDTLIYHDGWLPRDGVFKTSSPQVLGNFDKVSSLVTATGAWDSTLIRASFHEDEANAILSLPLPRRTTSDSLIWHYHKSGHYTVRSGYWLASQCRSVPSSSTSSITHWWKKFWRLRIPSKIRIFLWKAFHDWIPSSVNLVRHGVPSRNRCLICNEADDTTLHALWGCNTLGPLKVLCDSFIKFKLPAQCNFKEFLLSANDALSSENLEFLCILLWRIWFRRNKWIHEQIWLDDESCFSWARQHLADFVKANCSERDPVKKSTASTWQAPEIGVVKVNSDAAWCSKMKKFGLGSVIRDYTGKVLGSVATPIHSLVSVAVAESWALERGILLAKHLGYSAVILESDCLGVTKDLESRTLHDSDLSYAFDSIYEICNDLYLYKFSHTPRIGNQVAHNLARLALSLENEQIWPSGIPERIIPYVSADTQQLSSS
ncbi:hypothetical protein UlMin_024497 [Ulmus minor]